MITDIITNAASFSLPALLTVLGTFGFAPGFCMRLISLMYPPTDPRRQELYAEMKAVPRIERPIWVAEQLETGLFEGFGARRRVAKARKEEARKDEGRELGAREVRVRSHYRNGRLVKSYERRHSRPLAKQGLDITFANFTQENLEYVEVKNRDGKLYIEWKKSRDR